MILLLIYEKEKMIWFIWLGQGWYKTTTFGAAYEGPLVKAELDVLRNGKWEVVTKTDGSWYGRESGYSDTGTLACFAVWR